MDKQTKHQALLQHLHSLSAQPQEEVRYAIELLGKERGVQVVSAALEILAAAPGTEVRKVSEARTVLLRLYEYYDEAPVKRDAGGKLRGLILKALQFHQCAFSR